MNLEKLSDGSPCRVYENIRSEVAADIMRRIVDRVMLSAVPIPAVSEMELRNKVSGYVELISSAGKRDPDELAVLGLEYLRKIVEGPDPRFTGC